MGNINELLKLLAKTQKLTKVKFKDGKPIKIPSLLGSKKPKSISPKYKVFPLTGERVQWHIAIGLLDAPKHKKTQYKTLIPGKFKPPKLTKEQIEAWKNYGRGVFVKHLEPHVMQYDRDYLYGYARHVWTNRKLYKDKYVKEAKNYLLVHKRLGAPDLTKQYFLVKYGNYKIHKLGDDYIYQTLLKLRKTVVRKGEMRTIQRMLKYRKKQLSVTYADYYWLEYRRQRWEEKRRTSNYDMGFKLLEMREPSISMYWSYVRKEMGIWLSQSAWGKEEEFIKSFYSKYEGLDPAFAIGRGREKFPYEKLINWFIETGLEVPLHSTNLTHLKNPKLVLAMKQHLASHFTQEEIDRYIRDNLTNPENLSRTGIPDPGINVHSLYGYFRKTPRYAYFGQAVEKEVTQNLAAIETSFTKEYNRFAQNEKAKRDEFERDFSKFVPPADISSHFQVVLEHKKQIKKNLMKKKK